MAAPGIYHIMEFTTLVNLVKFRSCLIAVLNSWYIIRQRTTSRARPYQTLGYLLDSGLKKWHSWVILKPYFTKCTSLKRKDAFLGTCSGRMLIWKNVLIMKFVYMYLVGHHPLDVVTMLYKEQLWVMFQVTVKKRLIPSWEIFTWMMC